jgi:hypothetical protein
MIDRPESKKKGKETTVKTYTTVNGTQITVSERKPAKKIF